MRIENFKINDDQPSLVHLDVHRIEITNEQTELVVHSAKGRRVEKLANRAHFAGKIEGDKDSFVFLAVDDQGEMRSIIHRGDRVIVNELRAATDKRSDSNVSRKVDQQLDFMNRDFSCDVNGEFINQNKTPSTDLFRKMVNNAIEKKAAAAVAPQATQRRADIIVETDYEYYQKFNNTTAASNYVTDVFAYVSTKYQQEINARFLLKQINIYSTSADPWAQTTSSGLLNELRAYWNDASRSATSRHHVHLFSGKDTRGGIAYTNTLGMPSYGYGVSGSIEADFSASNPQIVWDSVVVAHEIGHAFGSDHTHNYDAPDIGSNAGGAIDCCYADTSGSQCGVQLGGAGKNGFLPGLGSITGGTAGRGNGTIMSYCHLLTPYMSNLTFTFGENHPYGVNPGRVATVMKSSAEQFLPTDTVSTYTLTVAKSGTGSGSVTSSPAGITCGSDCSESYASGTSVTLTATASSGSSFTGWTGDCTGTASTCTVSMSAARSTTASFTTTTASTRLISLTKSGTGTGTVSSSPSGISCTTGCGSASASFATTASVTLTATPASGSTFAGWSGACTGTGSCTIAAGSSAASVGATFNTSSSGGTTVTLLNKTGLSGATGSSQSFAVQVPSGATNLVISISGGTGDVDLYVKFGAAPTLQIFDCAPYSNTNDETCPFSAPKAGTYYILLDGAIVYSGVSLNVTYTGSSSGGSGPLPNAIDFVAQQYRDLLGREADVGGLSWVNQLNAGTVSRAQIVQSLMGSSESKNRYGPLVRLYTAYFLRQPDYAGLAYWLGQMFPSSGATGTSLAQVSGLFAQSAEFVNRYGSLSNDGFVNLVYQNVLGRQPDAAGKAYWLSQLNGGLSRGSLMIGFSDSPENQSKTANAVQITMGYVGLLRRSPSASDHAYWLAEIAAGRNTLLGFIDGILKSTEYAQRF
ncbi:MAG: DUF4214 domain-containing protein [Burkholderiaceae bacterium]|nr:DUF4214 domain-containing protein [Burkholderiaceae bacterium]